MTAYDETQQRIRTEPKKWLVTGVGGFIGSHLLEKLLQLDQRVVGLDNFATGKRLNLDHVKRMVTPKRWERFALIEGDIAELSICQQATAGVDFVLHQAGLGSVPRSIEDPIQTNQSNVVGFLNMLIASRDQKVKRFVYASSSSVYGDSRELPKVEVCVGRPASPYAVTKAVNELYAHAFSVNFGLECIGLRYFNIFGPRQDPHGPYTAVIPQWTHAILKGLPVRINGDGSTSRDFCYVANAVQANLLAATIENPEARGRVFNVAVGGRTTLNELFCLLHDRLMQLRPTLKACRTEHGPFRTGDVLHSQADISLAAKWLGYAPTHDLAQGLDETLRWYTAVEGE